MLQRVATIVIIIFVVLGGGVYAYKQLVPPPEEAQGPVYATKPVVKGDIAVGVETTGTLNPSGGGSLRTPGSRSANVSGSYSFILDELLAEEGDEIKKEQIVARLASPQLESKIESVEDKLEMDRKSLADLLNVDVNELNNMRFSRGITLSAPIDGRVIGLNVKEGQELQKGEIAAKIVDDSRFKLTAKVTVSEFHDIEVGQRVALKFQNFGNFLEAEVTNINHEPVPEPVAELQGNSNHASSDPDAQYTYVHWIEIEGANPGLVRSGMKVSVGFVDKNYKGKINISDMDYNNEVRWICYPAEIEGYVSEEKVLSSAEAIATEVHVHEMEKVKKGDYLVSLAGEDAQETIEENFDEIREQEEELRELRVLYDQMEVKSPMDGVVAHISRSEGESLNSNDWLGSIYNTSDMRMSVMVDDIDVMLISQESPVEVTLDAVSGKIYKGEVEFISTMGEERDGITRFRIEINVEGGAELRPGMQAKAFIDAGSAENVLLIPVEALFEEDNKPKVEVLNDDGTVKVATVKLGLMNDRVAEVKSGLKEGEQVIVGSSADLLPSQSIKSQDSLLPSTGDDNNQNGSEDVNQ